MTALIVKQSNYNRGLCTHACSSAVSRVSRMLHLVLIIMYIVFLIHTRVYMNISRPSRMNTSIINYTLYSGHFVGFHDCTLSRFHCTMVKLHYYAHRQEAQVLIGGVTLVTRRQVT